MAAQGKVTSRSPRKLFVGTDAPRKPQVIEERCVANRIEQRCRVPEDLAQAEGHFPGMPIVPGVVQLQWVIEVAKRLEPASDYVEVVEALKFHSLLRPGEPFELRVERTADSITAFRLHGDGQTFSSGRLRFGGGERS